MKKYYTLFAILFLYASLLAQDYKPMLNTVNEWQFLTCFQGDCNAPLDVYYTDGDTIVNNKSHKILDGFHYISREFLLREDVADKKVYLTTVIGGNIEEFLLYDFSLEIGDEFQMTNPYSPFPQDGGMFILYDVQELPLDDGELYKHYFFTPSPGNTQSLWEAAWVEGVGSLSIVTAPGGEPNFDNAGELCCSFDNGVNIYSNLERIPSCDGTLGTQNEQNLSDVTLLLVEDAIRLLDAEHVEQISIYDVYGRLVDTFTTLGESHIKISTQHLNRGLYIIIVQGTDVDAKTFKVVLK
ncbi:MAG: hypothetical protein ACI86C_000786 [Candidatus Latescibacterota bacterium]|jgi:hypothetical protein